jgi:excisionase family DNA binding protein
MKVPTHDTTGRADPAGLVDSDAAAAMLGVETRMVRRLVQERRIAFVKVGKLVRFKPEVLCAFIEANTTEPAR